ncbi:MAG TPA: M14 metallopeptidase family protein [Blastocatellia bacterium]|nr:M14 metallopeptidase family protein [Blastocatellia bacterium]
MIPRLRSLMLLFASALCLLSAGKTDAQTRITTPKEEFGFNFGDDYFLASYRQIAAYWHKLDRESDRMIVQEIGKTAEGRPHLMAVVTSPENHRNLARYREISRRLALAEGLTDDQARQLAKEGKAVVWIDGGLHATETLGAQQLGEMVFQMVSRNDEETLRLLNDVIILFVHANPDGNDLVADWYMRNPAPERRSLAGLPRLYQKYIGHDNNRDFFASTQVETENINRVLYHEWFPQILYNHHQSGPAGTVLWSPPLRDPYNYNLDPILVLGLQSLGAAMHTRLAVEGKPGATMRSGGPYDGWWNGGIRNTATFHNIIALLTEAIGSPTPMRIPLVMQRQLPSGDLAFPIAPQEWHFRQSVEYMISLNRAVLDYASRMKENLLFNIYRMGKNSIERGSRDNWTANPKLYAEVASKMASNQTASAQTASAQIASAQIASESSGRNTPNAERDSAYWAELRKPEFRDPRGFIIPSDQPDFPTATKFINALLETGITAHRATRDFEVLGKKYPSGSFVVFTAQAFRPHVMDMFEPQVHPDVFPYPGSPPTPPYDNAGWTLAFQMGVQFDRILESFTGPFEKIQAWNVAPPVGRIKSTVTAKGYLTSRRVNNAFTAVNRLLKSGEEVNWLQSAMTANGQSYPAGALYVAAKSSTRAAIDKIAVELGVSFDAVAVEAPADALKLRTARIGLWDQYGGSMDSGWARWILEQFEFPFERVFVPALDAGDLNSRFDVLIFVGGGIPGASGGGGRRGPVEPPQNVPAEYQSHLGRVSVEKTLPQIKEFIEKGGAVIAIGESSANLAAHLKLPLENYLVEEGRPLPRTRYYVPGSILSARIDAAHPIAHGMDERADMFFENNPVFKLSGESVKSIAWFDTKTPLRSGWAWGQQYLENGVVAVEAKIGKGKVILFGPEILKRAQPHGAFKLLFNGIYYGSAN